MTPNSPISILPSTDDLEISAAATARLIAEHHGEFDLIDCREEDEWTHCRIEGARLIPLTRFPEMATTQLRDRERPLVVYCHHGMRSAHAAGWLRSKGWRAWSLRGGINAWSEEIDPSVPRY